MAGVMGGLKTVVMTGVIFDDFVLGDDVLQDFSYDSDGIMFNEGEVRVYIRG